MNNIRHAIMKAVNLETNPRKYLVNIYPLSYELTTMLCFSPPKTLILTLD